jgi:hypothetical protein
MRAARTSMDRETAAKLTKHGIFVGDGLLQRMSKEQALVLIGEAMFEHFVEEFRDVWHEIFSLRQSRQIEVSAERVEAYFRKQWKPTSKYRRIDRLKDEYVQDRVIEPPWWYSQRGGDKYGMAGTYRFH